MGGECMECGLNVRVAMLAKTAWGGAFADDELRWIADRMSLLCVPAGETIFRQGESGASLFLIVRGVVEISCAAASGREKMLVTLHPGSPFGEMSLIDEQPRSATAMARDDVDVLVLDEDAFADIVAAKPDLGLKLVRSVARLISMRLRQMDNIMVDFLG